VLGLDPESLMITKGENLPSWVCEEAMYHVCFRLADSLPFSQVNKWKRERELLLAKVSEEGGKLAECELIKMQYLFSEKVEKYLDAGIGECYLSRDEIAQVVVGAIRHFDRDRYDLHAWCVMPNHVHVIVKPLGSYVLKGIIHSWKSFTASKSNRILGRKGAFWQRDAYNHIIRSEKEYNFQVDYVWNNPEKANLKDWKWRWKLGADSQGKVR
jgi:REP element-mobilizing transposase RayT